MTELNHQDQALPWPLGCEAGTQDWPCRRAARYTVAVEEDGPGGSEVIATRQSCARHLTAIADWALSHPAPFSGEAQDAYLTEHERGVTISAWVPRRS